LDIETEKIAEDNFLQILQSLDFRDGLAVIDDILKDTTFWSNSEDKEARRRFEQQKT